MTDHEHPTVDRRLRPVDGPWACGVVYAGNNGESRVCLERSTHPPDEHEGPHLTLASVHGDDGLLALIEDHEPQPAPAQGTPDGGDVAALRQERDRLDRELKALAGRLAVLEGAHAERLDELAATKAARDRLEESASRAIRERDEARRQQGVLDDALRQSTRTGAEARELVVKLEQRVRELERDRGTGQRAAEKMLDAVTTAAAPAPPAARPAAPTRPRDRAGTPLTLSEKRVVEYLRKHPGSTGVQAVRALGPKADDHLREAAKKGAVRTPDPPGRGQHAPPRRWWTAADAPAAPPPREPAPPASVGPEPAPASTPRSGGHPDPSSDRRAAVLAALADGPRSHAQLRDATGLGGGSLTKVLVDLRGHGAVDTVDTDTGTVWRAKPPDAERRRLDREAAARNGTKGGKGGAPRKAEQRPTVRARVLDAVRADPGALNEDRLAMALNLDREQVAEATGALVERGVVSLLPEGTYAPGRPKAPSAG